MLDDFLHKLYDGFDVSTEIEPTAWREVLRIMNTGAVEGLTESKSPPTHEEGFLHAIKHSNEVFAAFKTHAMGVKMAERLVGEDGKLRPFDEWKKSVAPIARHHVGSWLRTEYDTAVIRAHQAADWIEFEENKDIFPNLQWMATTSVSPEEGHAVFWRKPVILPINDPFWQEHRPGDRWNCKCSLEATDDAVQRLDAEEQAEARKPQYQPQRGLEGNPIQKGLITDKHPYYPESCAKCPFYASKGFKGWARRHLTNRVKDCHNCPYVDQKIIQAKLEEKYPTDRWEQSAVYPDTGGYVVTELERKREAQTNRDEKKKFEKELSMCKVAASHGYQVEFLSEKGRPLGQTYDIHINGMPAELKSTSSAGNLMKHVKKAFTQQGAEAVVIRFESRDEALLERVYEAKRKYPDKTIIYYYEDDPSKIWKL